jgi:hypothetical protein
MKLLLVTVSAAVVLACTSSFASVPKTDRLLPESTTLFVEVGNFTSMVEHFKATGFYRLWKDPAMAAFVAQAEKAWRERAARIDNELARTILSARILPSGRVGAAFAPSGRRDKRDDAVIILAEWGPNARRIGEMIDRMVVRAVEQGFHHKKTDYRGITISSVKKSGHEETGTGVSGPKRRGVEFSETHFCFVEDCLIVSSDIELLKFVLTRIRADASTALASEPEYSAMKRHLGPGHDLGFYLSIKQIIGAALAEDADGKIRSTMDKLGISNVAALGAGLGFAGRPGVSFRGKSLLKINGEKKGVCRMLEMLPAAPDVPRFVPSSAYSVSIFNIDIRKAYGQLQGILYSFSPMHAAMLHTMDIPEGPDGRPGVNFKTDVIDHLGSQIILAHTLNKPFTADRWPAESLLAVAVNNRDAVSKSIDTLHERIIGQGAAVAAIADPIRHVRSGDIVS